ncbi:orotidine 5'-phosphate decarboxylase / HUMPS family protein [Acidianus sp. HS-5]|uniref:orotidine 5'-phosphate decarboxylase / HUMPS family protein n=1 Tax=Acidianus sp. HS-5 TaxID=2886040 RepID=UPI001F00F71C|nr:orotidine 5'-phosphate decarboxylase / HUMPS family protein [Acidianus sp. HS-5]BDC19633.1 orotidine 5'-phosphate decarboxylase [Acidianus sp. HS-5]
MDEEVPIEALVKVSEYLYGIKIGYPLLLRKGVEGVKEILRGIKVDEVIMDLKLADIDNTMISIVKQLNFADSFIAHSFIGIKGALGELKDFLDEERKKLYLLSSMSHKGWNDELYPYIREVIKNLNPYGIVAPATKIEVLRKVRKDFPDKVIISPGVGAQGGKIGDALCNGADYEIIGRIIYTSSDLESTVKEIFKIQEEKINECKKTSY